MQTTNPKLGRVKEKNEEKEKKVNSDSKSSKKRGGKENDQSDMTGTRERSPTPMLMIGAGGMIGGILHARQLGGNRRKSIPGPNPPVGKPNA